MPVEGVFAYLREPAFLTGIDGGGADCYSLFPALLKTPGMLGADTGRVAAALRLIVHSCGDAVFAVRLRVELLCLTRETDGDTLDSRTFEDAAEEPIAAETSAGKLGIVEAPVSEQGSGTAGLHGD